MTRDDLARFAALDIDFESIGLMDPCAPVEDDGYFCDPAERENVGRIGCDGIHFILLPGDERVFCVDPSMGEPGTYVLPVAKDFRTFLSYVLYCRDANPLSQIWWLSEERFRQLLTDDANTSWPGCEDYFARKQNALELLSSMFDLLPRDPYKEVRKLQQSFDPAVLCFSDEYYDVLGLER